MMTGKNIDLDENKTENGFAIYLVLGFIVIITLNLTTLGQHLTQQNKIQFKAITAQKTLHKAHTALQFGLLEMRGQAAAIAANETGYALPAGISGSDIASHRQICLTNHGSYTSSNTGDFLASAVLEDHDIKSRYFIYDASGASLPRKFEIYGCAIKNNQTRLAYGVWVFSAPSQSFNLVKTELF